MGSGVVYRGSYRERQRQKAQAEAKADLEQRRRWREEILTLNAKLNARDPGSGRFVVPPNPDLPAAQDNGPRLGSLDLRSKGAPVVLRGKRGRCQECKVKLTSRRGWFCPSCKERRARHGRR
jgi:lipopolysaccharide biosynthesis regulator YciM